MEINSTWLGRAVSDEAMLPDTPEVKPSEAYKYGIDGFDTLKRQFEDDSLAVIGYQKYKHAEQDDKFYIDDAFDAKSVWTPELEQSIHPKFKDAYLSRARNQQHFDELKGYYEKESAIERELDSYGFGRSLLYGGLAELTNAPLYVTPAALLPRTAAILGSRATSRMVTSGSAGVAIEGLKDVLGEQDKDKLDYAAAFLFDGALGAAIGARTGKFGNMMNDMVLRQHGISRDILEKVKSVGSKEERNTIIQDAYYKHSGEQADKSLLDILDDNVEFANQNMVQKAWGSLRQDMAYVTGESVSPTLRNFSGKMFPDATLQNLDLNHPDMATEKDLLEETMRRKRQSIFAPLTKEYVKMVHNSKGGFFGIRPTGLQEREFSNMLGEIQTERGLDGISIEEAVKRVMNRKNISANREELSELLERSAKGMEDLSISHHKALAENGHSDFADGIIKEDGTYMPFVYDKESIAKLLNKGVKKGAIADFFKQAIKNNMGEEIDDELLNAISMAFYKAVSENNVKRMNTFDSVMDEILSSKEYTDDVKEMVSKIKKTKRSNGGDAKGNFGNQRTNIDYSHKQTFKTADGGEVEISFRDFLSKDYLNNMDTYARKMSGTTVLRKYGWDIDARMKDADALDPDDFKSHGEYLKAYNDIKQKNNIVETGLRQMIENEPAFRKLKNQIDDLRGKQTDEGLELLRTVANSIAETISPRVAKSVKEALAKNDYQGVADIIFKATDGIEVKKPLNIGTKERSLLEKYISHKKSKADIEATMSMSGQGTQKQINAVWKYNDEMTDIMEELESIGFKDIDDAINSIKLEQSIAKVKEVLEDVLSGKKRALDKIDIDGKTYYKLDTGKKNEPIVVDSNGNIIGSGKGKGISDVVEASIKAGSSIVNDIDTKRFFELMDEFITNPNSKIKELEAKYETDFNAKLKEGVDAAHNPTEFRMKTKEDYDTFRNKIREELDNAVQSGEITVKEADKDLVRLDTILKEMTGVATSKDPTGNLNRFYRIAHSYNVGRLLGQTFFTMPAEAMNVMWDVGMKSFIETLPSLKSLLRAYRSGNIDHAQTREIADSLGMYDEFLSSPRLYEFDHDFNAATSYGKASKVVDKIEAWGENFAEFTLMTGGIKPLTAWFQTAHVMGVFKKMRAVAEGGAMDTKYRKMIKELGLSKEMEIKVYDSILENFDNGKMNFNEWDTDIKNVFLQGVKRRTDTLVQMQRIGDKPAWVSEPDFMFRDTFIGKVTMELKQFVMTAYVKQLGRALNRKDQYMIGLIASQMTSLTLAYMAKQTLNYAGNDEKFQRAMQIENIIAGTMGMMPQGSVLPMVMNFGTNLMWGEDLIGSSRHNSQATDMISSLAIIDGISKLMEVFAIPAEIAKGDGDCKTLKPAASVSGVSNHWLTKALWESTQNCK